MKTMRKVLVIAICLFIAQTVLMGGPEQARSFNYYDYGTLTTSASGVTATGTVSYTADTSPYAIHVYTNGQLVTSDWTGPFGDSHAGPTPPTLGITYNLKYSPTYSTTSSLNYVNVILNSNLVDTSKYYNYGTTSVSAGKYLKAGTGIVNYGLIQGAGKLIGTVSNGGTIKVGGSTSGMDVQGVLDNYIGDGPSGTLVMEIGGILPCGEGLDCSLGTYSVLYGTPNPDTSVAPRIDISYSTVEFVLTDGTDLAALAGHHFSLTDFFSLTAGGTFFHDAVTLVLPPGFTDSGNGNFDYVGVPEPTTMLLLGLGLIGLAGIRRKYKN